MDKWRIETKRERAHAEPVELGAWISSQEIGGLVDCVFRCDQLSEGTASREKLRFDFTASRGPLRLSMTGLYWPPEVSRIYEDAEREAYDRTTLADAREGNG